MSGLPQERKRLWSVDVLRGLCAGVVFLSHWHVWSRFTPQNGFEQSVQAGLAWIYDLVAWLTWPIGGNHPAVIAFFILSGFCIHSPNTGKARSGSEAPVWRGYYRRRFLRIMPVYWSAALLGFLYLACFRLLPSPDALLSLHAEGTPAHLAVRVAGIAGIYPQEVIAGNYLLNTVSSEILMYAVYPLFFAETLRPRGWLKLGAFFLLLHVGSLSLLPFVSPYWLFNSVAMMGIFWFLGALVAEFAARPRFAPKLLHALLLWVLFLTIKQVPHFSGLNMLKQAAWGLCCAVFLLWAIKAENQRASWAHLAWVRFMRLVADLSYSLYAVHTPVIMLGTWMLLCVFDCRNYSLQLLVNLGAPLLITYLVWRRVEQRFYRH